MIYAKGTEHYSQPLYEDLRALFRHHAKSYAEQPAYAYRLEPRGKTYFKTYKELLNDVEALGTALLEQNLVQVGEPVALLGDNSYAWAVTHATVLFGLGLSVPLDRQLSEGELRSLCQRSRCVLLCSDEAHLDLARKVALQCPSIRSILLLDCSEKPFEHKSSLEVPSSNETASRVSKKEARLLSFAQLLSKGQNLLQQDCRSYLDLPIKADQAAALFFTSGTTSLSKGVLLSQKNILHNARNGLRALYCKPGSRCLSLLPIHHTFENTVGMFAQLWNHNCIYFNDGLRHFLYNLKDWKIEVMLAVPLLLESMYKQLRNGIRKKGKEKSVVRIQKISALLRKCGLDLRRRLFAPLLKELGGELRLIIAGAAALSPEIMEFFDMIGIDCMLGYGLTEAGPMIAANNQSVFRPGTVGQPLTDHEVRIDNGLDFSDAEHPGEVLARSACIMVGYYEDEALTQEVLDEKGWLHTGDIGYLDQDGCLVLTGRQKSMIVLTNGKKLFPEEIEALLQKSPGITAAFVWGQENHRGNIDPCASLLIERKSLPAELKKASEEELGLWLQQQIDQVNAQMPVYKAIKYFVWSETGMELTTTLKVKRAAESRRLTEKLRSVKGSMRDLNRKCLEA